MIEENQTSIQIQTTPPEATINSNTSTIQIPSIPDVNPRKSKRKPRRKSNINPSASKTKEKIEENLPNETQIIETIIETLHPDVLNF